MRCMKFWFLGISTAMLVVVSSHWGTKVMALPPVEDIPEEILRTEIITIGRSPIDGKLLTAAEYAQIQAQLQTSPPPKLNAQIREKIFLLQLRKTLLQLFPFLDI
ncbi:hypothetical protein PN497_10730 [Sphaerospermopsis kisseleviana CS-549]|uniref:Glutathione S-transferase n=2 Tax=Sphaerospermopsis TaxID=752201 RepID=A0ABT4ZQZ2_9CYAN|nr:MULTISPECIES: hypothetical protein [Sphaerospermopsis]MBD2133266.1 hypothetical protein [Sphaerospermopsis sp. FACHB-1094]MBD2146896.1 hypothetical protein [Sphaerospermopsis sp. FACHB-1194]MDB9441831.1 hypothetical protein [Sphaerospermopsis kisseleviana CS-549]